MDAARRTGDTNRQRDVFQRRQEVERVRQHWGGYSPLRGGAGATGGGSSRFGLVFVEALFTLTFHVISHSYSGLGSGDMDDEESALQAAIMASLEMADARLPTSSSAPREGARECIGGVSSVVVDM